MSKGSIRRSIDDEFSWNQKNIGVIVLGLGLIFFILNAITIISSIPHIIEYKLPTVSFYISLFSSVSLMMYAAYNIYVSSK